MHKFIELILRRYKLLSSIFVIIILFVISYLIYINRSNKVIAYDENEQIIKDQIEKEETVEEAELKKIKIDIKGSIANPGVYELDEGSRVVDAINAAGGLLEEADTSYINLSKILKDQNVIIINSKTKDIKEPEKITEYVYLECECPKFNDACITNEVVNYQENSSKNEIFQDNIGTNNEAINNMEENSGQVSINNASYEELINLSGIGESKAKSIIKYREENGPFTAIEDIKNISGIGDNLFEKIKDNITL